MASRLPDEINSIGDVKEAVDVVVAAGKLSQRGMAGAGHSEIGAAHDHDFDPIPDRLLIQLQIFHLKFKLILVDANPKIRFERLKSRNRPGDPKTLEEFKKQESAVSIHVRK
jgi:hypothetical protein